MVSWWPRLMWMPAACAAKIDGEERYSADPAEIEGVAGGDDEGDDVARDAEGFHGLHGARERGFAGAGGEGDGGGFGDGAEKSAKGKAREEQRGQHRHEREDDERNVERERELAEVEHDAESRLRDGEGECGGDADGREKHDEVGEGEHHFGEGFAEAQHGVRFVR